MSSLRTIANTVASNLTATTTSTTASSNTLTTAKQTYFRIRLMRSAIGLPRRYRGVLDALGLRRRLAVVYQPVTRDIAGMIVKVKELVDVEEVVGERKSRLEMAAERKSEPGYYVETRAAQVVQTRAPGAEVV